MFNSDDTDDEQLVIDLDVDTDRSPQKQTSNSSSVQSASQPTVQTVRHVVNRDGGGDTNVDKVQTNSLGTIGSTASCRSGSVTGSVRDIVAANTWMPAVVASSISHRETAQKGSIVDPCGSVSTDTSDRTTCNTGHTFSAILTTFTTASTTYSRSKAANTSATTAPTRSLVAAACVGQTVANSDSCGGRKPPTGGFISLISAAAATKASDNTASSSSSSSNSGNNPLLMTIKLSSSSQTVSVTSALPLLPPKPSSNSRQSENRVGHRWASNLLCGSSVDVVSEREVKSARSPANKKCPAIRSISGKESSGKSSKASNCDERRTASPLDRTASVSAHPAESATSDLGNIAAVVDKKEIAGKSSSFVSILSSLSSSSSSREMPRTHNTENSRDPYEFNVKVEDCVEKPCKKLKAVERSEVACSPIPGPLWLEERTASGTRDVAVGVQHIGVVTDPDCLGPCEPGSSVTLEGIVWNETDNGLLVVNVTWRGRTYVGTLMDATKHHWAPPRSTNESPTIDADGRAGKGRGGKRGRANSTNTSRFDAACSDRKLRSNRCASNNSNNNNRMPSLLPPPIALPPPSPAKSDSGSSMKRARIELLDACHGSKMMKLDAVDSSPPLIECPQAGCCKKFRSTHALRFHQTKAHKSLCSDISSDSNGDSDSKGSKVSESKATCKENKKNDNYDTKTSDAIDVRPERCDVKDDVVSKSENTVSEIKLEEISKAETDDTKVEAMDEAQKLICDEKIDFTELMKEEMQPFDNSVDQARMSLTKTDFVLPPTGYTINSLAETNQFSTGLVPSKTGLGNLNLPLVASPSMLVQCSSLVSVEPNSDCDLLGKSPTTSVNIMPKNSTNDMASVMPTNSTSNLGDGLSPSPDDLRKPLVGENSGHLNESEEDVRKRNASAGISLALLCNSDLATRAFHSGAPVTSSNQHSPSLSMLGRPGTLPFNYGSIDAKGQILCDSRSNIRSSAEILNDARNSGMYLTGNTKTSIPLDHNLRVAPLASSNMAAIEAVNSQMNKIAEGDVFEGRESKKSLTVKCERPADNCDLTAVDYLDRSATHSPAYSDISDANENAPMLEKESEEGEQDSSTMVRASISLANTSSSCGINVSSVVNNVLVGAERTRVSGGYLYSPMYGQPPYLTPVVTGSNTDSNSGLALSTSASLTRDGTPSYSDDGKNSSGNPDMRNRKRDFSGNEKISISSTSSTSGLMPGGINSMSTRNEVKLSDANTPHKLSSRESSERPTDPPQGFPASSHVPLMHPMFSPVPVAGGGFTFGDARFSSTQATNSWLMNQQFLQQQQQRFMFHHPGDLTRLPLNNSSSLSSASPPQSAVKSTQDKSALPTPPCLIPDKARTPLTLIGGSESDSNVFLHEKIPVDGGPGFSESSDSNRSKSRNESPASESARFLPHHQIQRQSLGAAQVSEPSGSHVMISKHTGESGVGGTSKPSAVVAPQSRGSMTSGSRPQSRHSGSMEEILDNQHDSNSRESISRNALDGGYNHRDGSRGTKRLAPDSDRPGNKTPVGKGTSEQGSSGKGDTPSNHSGSGRSFPSSVIKSKEDVAVALPSSVPGGIPSSLSSPAPPFPHMFGHYLGHGPMQYAPGFEHPGIYPPGIGPVIGYAAGPSGYLPNPLLAPAPPLLLSPTRSQASDIKAPLVGPLPPHSAAPIPPGYFAGGISPINDGHMHKIHELKDVGKAGGGMSTSRGGGAVDRPKERVAPSPPENGGDGSRGRPDSRSERCASVGIGKEQELHSSPPTQRHHHMHHHMHVQFGHPIYPLYGRDAAAAALMASQQATSASLQRPPYLGKS